MSCYIILNEDNRICTVSEKNDNVLSEGQTLMEEDLSLHDFVTRLPDVPVNCVFSDGVFVKDALPVTVIYNGDVLISWALGEVQSGNLSEALLGHMSAFLDFANKATQVSYVNFMTYASAVNLTETAATIVDKAIELGADIGVV